MAAAYGLYTHIQSNKRRSIGLLIGLFFLIYVLTYAGALLAEALFIDVPSQDISQYMRAPVPYFMRRAWIDLIASVPFVTVGTVIWIIIAYYFNVSIIDAITGGEDVTRDSQPRLYNLLENLCISRGITMPKLKIIESNALNAFASGVNQQQYSISVTTGLLNKLDDAELEAVLGHELTHIRNGDVRMLICAVVIAGVISFVGEVVFRGFFRSGLAGGRGSKKGAGLVILIALAIVAACWILSIVVRFSLSRKREFLADAGSVELTKNPDAMISALRKIEGRSELPDANSAIMEMCIDNPREGFDNLFDTHPSVEKRVAALVQFAGGHDPGPINLPWEQEPEFPDEDSELPKPWQSAPDSTTGADAPAPEPPRNLPPPAGPWGPTRTN